MKKVIELHRSALDRFLYWIEERHRIFLKKDVNGEEKPWTKDPVLQKYFFTNPYRENDKTTAWFRDRVRDPLRDSSHVVMATVIFRWFNKIQTGEDLIALGKGSYGYLVNWNSQEVATTFRRLVTESGYHPFTGAFMINSPPRRPKLEAICERIDKVWEMRKALVNDLRYATTLEQAHADLSSFDGLGGFMAYEIVCDLRYTTILCDATDIMTWCNPGPGCIRGLYRLTGREIKNKSNATSPPRPKDWMEVMKYLLTLVRKELYYMPRFEMREIEHSLCEFDKYERARLGDGRMKRTYQGV